MFEPKLRIKGRLKSYIRNDNFTMGEFTSGEKILLKNKILKTSNNCILFSFP